MTTPTTTELLQQVELLREALEDLVGLKLYKEKYGKDADYQELRDGVWAKAIQALSATTTTKPQKLKMTYSPGMNVEELVLYNAPTKQSEAGAAAINERKEYERYDALVNLCKDVWDERQREQIMHLTWCTWQARAALSQQSNGRSE
jgi:hypothetical protein